jgi:hypothetical protein
MSDDLEMFLNWYTRVPSIGMVPTVDPVHYLDGVTCVTMYRKAPYQVQMFIVPPNHIIPAHTHPNVDSFEVYVGGQINFSHSGKWVATEEEVYGEIDEMPQLRGRAIRVLPNDLHGGTFGPKGGVFLSVQKWLNGKEPTCVAADYDGPVMGPEHMAHVTDGAPELRKTLTAADALNG